MGAKHKMTADQARICAEALTTGYVQDGAVVRPFDSIKDAWSLSPTLQHYMLVCGYRTPNHMYEAMMQLCPGAICKVSRDMKLRHTDEQRLERQRVARALLGMLADRPDALLHTIYFDEVHIRIRASDAPHYGVYVDPCDPLAKKWVAWVADVPGALLDQDIHINLLAAVNAILGPVYIEYVSGTTDSIGYRLHWAGAPPIYFVSHNAPHCPGSGACTCSC
jgi:hypothetical protein